MLTEQLKTLEAVCNRLIPADEFPGAWEAGVGEYILRLLETDCRAQQSDYAAGLAALETEALAKYNASFAALSVGQQDVLLTDVEKGNVTTVWPVPPARVFSLWVNHTAEGYYSNPENGGNRGKVSWQMIGFYG